MAIREPTATAVVLLGVSALVLVSALASRVASRVGVPVVLLFLALGILAGTDGIGGLEFENHGLAFRIGAVALVLILFDGGLNTKASVLRTYAAPAGVLATAGVVGTAALVGLAAHAVGIGWKQALLLGSIVSSTDAAAVFSVLRGGGIHIRDRVASTVEIESGLNDPMAVILTVVLTDAIATNTTPDVAMIGLVLVQLAVGALMGMAVAVLGKYLLLRSRVPAAGLYPLFTIALAFVAFGLATIADGSGFLAVYVAGVGIGKERLPYRPHLYRVHDFLAWGSQLVMFVVLGLLATPSRVIGVAGTSLGLALFLALVARPTVVFACLLPFRYPIREIAFIAWGGLKGAVPIVLALMPILADVEGALRIFDAVFFVVFVSAVLQGSTMRWLARKLGVAKRSLPPVATTVEIVSTRPLSADLLAFQVMPASAVNGVTLAEIPFPPGSSAMLVVRGEELVAPRGETRLQDGDQVYVFCKVEDRTFFQLAFGRMGE